MVEIGEFVDIFVQEANALREELGSAKIDFAEYRTQYKELVDRSEKNMGRAQISDIWMFHFLLFQNPNMNVGDRVSAIQYFHKPSNGLVDTITVGKGIETVLTKEFPGNNYYLNLFTGMATGILAPDESTPLYNTDPTVVHDTVLPFLVGDNYEGEDFRARRFRLGHALHGLATISRLSVISPEFQDDYLAALEQQINLACEIQGEMEDLDLSLSPPPDGATFYAAGHMGEHLAEIAEVGALTKSIPLLKVLSHMEVGEWFHSLDVQSEKLRDLHPKVEDHRRQISAYDRAFHELSIV